MKSGLHSFIIILILIFSIKAYMITNQGSLPKQDWPHKGIMGEFDKTAIKRGFQIYKDACISCYSFKYLSYRDLKALGYNNDEIRAIASEYTVIEGVNAEGTKIIKRKALPSDRFVMPAKAGKIIDNVVYTPEQSLVHQVRKNSEDYLFALFTSSVDLTEDMSYNGHLPGQQLSTVSPIFDEDPAIVADSARDVIQFLVWASDPHIEQRKKMGRGVIIFLALFAGIMYALKRKVWSQLK